MHKRLRPRVHQFKHRVYFLRIPLSALGELPNRWLAVDSFNLVSFQPRDYGPRDGTDYRAWCHRQLASVGVPLPAGEIVLQTFPRVLGYVFNPISFWYCYNPNNELRAVISEVNNTFGECHHYVLTHPDFRTILPGDDVIARKVFHVSPFCEVKGHYRMRFTQNQTHCHAAIDYYDGSDDASRLLLTMIMGRPAPLNSRSTLSAVLRNPLLTLAVVVRIHWHAVRLWLKRTPWFAKPSPPATRTSL